VSQERPDTSKQISRVEKIIHDVSAFGVLGGTTGAAGLVVRGDFEAAAGAAGLVVVSGGIRLFLDHRIRIVSSNKE
jgi:hypothetical protein